MVAYILFMAAVLIILFLLWKKMKTNAAESDNFIIISDSKINFSISPMKKEKFDELEAVMDEDRSLRNDLVIWGSSKTFGVIKKLQEGEKIFLNLSNEWTKYEVVRSEEAFTGNKEIFSQEDGIDLLNGELKFEVLRIISCAEDENRCWVVICRKTP